MSEMSVEYVTYAHHPSAEGETELVSKVFRDPDAGPVPLLVWFHSGAFHAGTIEARPHNRIARQFTARGYGCAFVQYRLRARPEDLRPVTRALLPDLVADAEQHAAEIRPNMTGERALAAVEDGVAFLDWLRENAADHGLSGQVLLGGSSAGGITVLNILSLAPRLGLTLPDISTAFVMSGAFAYPSFFTPSAPRVLALHGSHEQQLPVSSIRAYAARPGSNCTLLEERHHLHGDLRLDEHEKPWRAVERMVQFDQGAQFAPARTAVDGDPVKDKHRICIYTCVKNEGPFLLEWIAHNRAIGVTDFIIFSNDCEDGTAEMLDHLDALDIVNHIRNPSTQLQSREHLRLTAVCAPFHNAFRKADYSILTDVDEFIDVNVGDGTLNGLIAAAGYPDVLSIPEVLYGFGGVERFEDRLVTEQFRLAQTLDPTEDLTRRGVKSFVRVCREIRDYSNHRPQPQPEAIDDIHWIDGAGLRVSRRFIQRGHRGYDVRGRYRLARLNHYSLRSGDSMLMKSHRGDSVRPGRMKLEYLSNRNGRDLHDDSFLRRVPALKAELAEMLQDKKLALLHENSVRWHKAMIARLKEREQFAEIWQAIRKEVAEPCLELQPDNAAE
ncbi:MAG: glycosyltransferase family 92 protein [Rhodobacteraceae bacterium]|nr:glycosyltransferase family 92 protein [Paracoccaceae bacterium]